MGEKKSEADVHLNIMISWGLKSSCCVWENIYATASVQKAVTSCKEIINELGQREHKGQNRVDVRGWVTQHSPQASVTQNVIFLSWPTNTWLLFLLWNYCARIEMPLFAVAAAAAAAETPCRKNSMKATPKISSIIHTVPKKGCHFLLSSWLTAPAMMKWGGPIIRSAWAPCPRYFLIPPRPESFKNNYRSTFFPSTRIPRRGQLLILAKAQKKNQEKTLPWVPAFVWDTKRCLIWQTVDINNKCTSDHQLQPDTFWGANGGKKAWTLRLYGRSRPVEAQTPRKRGLCIQLSLSLWRSL